MDKRSGGPENLAIFMGVICVLFLTFTARALLNRYPDVVGEIVIGDTFWAKSFLQQMGMVRGMKAISKLLIPEGAIKEAGLLFKKT